MLHNPLPTTIADQGSARYGEAMNGSMPADAEENAAGLGWRGDPRHLVLEAFREAVADASSAASRGEAELDESVHEYRKALRRARAILALLRPTLGRDAHDAIRDELRAARRQVSIARDHHVAGGALAQLGLESQEREGANHLLVLLQSEEPAASESCEHLRQGASSASEQLSFVEQLAPDDLTVADLVEGLAGTYRQARAARRAAKRSRRAFHRWRRRCKELDAQLALLAAHAGERTAELRRLYGDVADSLGPIADLIMLRDLSAAYQARHPDAPFGELEDALGDLTRAQIRSARKLAKPLFLAKPAKLAKLVRRAIEQDLTDQVAPEGDDPGDSDHSRDD